MTKAAIYDWSVLERDLVAEMINFASDSTVGKSLSPTKFADKIRSIFKFFKIPVKVRSTYKLETDKDTVWVGGLYDGVADKKGKTAITISLQFHQQGMPVKIKSNAFRRMCYSVADTLMHEIIHMRQYRRRNFKDIPGYESTASLAKKRNEQIYLGHDDEIDAYSFNIACQLMDRFNRDVKKIANYLNKDLNDRRFKKDAYRMYLDTFDHDHSHRVIKKLKKKVINYLPNAVDLGKPYKTTDWLKK